MSEKSSSGEKLLYCSFCGKSQHEVRKLIAGPSVFICDECIELCNDIIREETASDKGGKGVKSDLPTPREIRQILDQYVIGQDTAKKILSVAVYNHYKLLKLVEGTIASVPPQGGRKHPNQDFVQVDTTNILFVCGGAFDGLEKIVRNRTEKTGIGFGAEIKSPKNSRAIYDLLKNVEPEDLIKYGLIPEFVGRLPVLATLEELDEHALIQILTEPKNALIKQYQRLFLMEGVELEVRTPALGAVAKRALARKTGARGLRSILEQVLLDTMYELPTLEDVSKVVVDEQMISADGKPLLIYSDQHKVAGSTG